MSVKLIYEDIAVGAEDDAEVTASEASENSNISLLPYGAEASERIATGEWNRWILNGSTALYKQQPAVFWSTSMSGADCTFSVPPTITISFDEQYTSLGINLVFDEGTGEYCSSVTIKWYRDGTLIDSADFSPDSIGYFCEHTVEAYDRIVIKLNATSLPYRYARLTRVVFGIDRVFDLDELQSVQITEEISVISSEVAINTLDFGLYSRNAIEYIFQRRQPVYAYDNNHLIGTFYISESARKGSNIYEISCVDAIGILDEESIPAAMYTGQSARSVLEGILGGYFELEMDAVLDDIPIAGHIPEGTRREALQQVAFAMMAVADTSGTDKVRVFRTAVAEPSVIPAGRIYLGGDVKTSAIVTAVKVTYHTYTEGGDTDTVEAGGVTYSHTTGVKTITNPVVTATDKQNVVEVKDATLINADNVDEVAQHIYNYYMRREEQNVKVVMQGEKPGDYVTTLTPWQSELTGHIARMDIILSGLSAADCTIVGAAV